MPRIHASPDAPTVTPVPGGATTTGLTDDPRLARALEDFLAECREGQAPDRSAFLARHPEIADALGECLDGLAFVQSAAPYVPPEAVRGERPAGAPEPLGPRAMLGDFRIIRQVGRGGMGVVFEAEQLSLGRRVALKVLPFASALDPRQRQRFQVEAQAAACLHHTHIVPVYSVGCDRGTHYYAMQFIEGRTLGDLIAELRAAADEAASGKRPGREPAPDAEDGPTPSPSPSPGRGSGTAWPRPGAASISPGGTTSTRSRTFLRGAARLGVEAAEALEHAHGLGILHRDIKPSNLMVDNRGSLWVTDFGLARVADDSSLTRSGDLLGTLRYMSPEQAQARHGIVDERSDLYALGATLYELLTLRPAFDAKERHELLRKIVEEEPVPPRRINPAVPRDLETIVLKALAKEPQARYTTASELADDLNRFLDDQPVHARRPSPWQRAVKFARRHRAVLATALTVLFLAMAVGSALLWAEQRKTERERANLEAALADRKAIQEREWRNVAATFDALDTWGFPLMGRAAVAGLLRGDEGRTVYDEAIALYESIARTYQGNEFPALRTRAARAVQRAGYFRMILSAMYGGGADELARASDDYRRAIVEFEALAEAQPGNIATQLERAALLDEFAMWLESSRKPNEARPNRDEARRIREALIEAHPGNPVVVQGYADAQLSRVAMLYRANRAEADALVEKVADLAERLASERGVGSVPLLTSLGNRVAQHRPYRARAAAILERALALAPDDVNANNTLAWLLCSYPADQPPHDPERAAKLARKAVDREPGNRDAWNTLGVALWRAGDCGEAVAALEKSMTLSNGGDPADWLVLAMIRQREGRSEEARKLFDRSAAQFDGNLTPIDPSVRSLRNEAARALGIEEGTPKAQSTRAGR
jgi:serine/threonine protein kinase